jgi:hypothetical protein
VRFIAAIISFVLAFGLIAYGIAQRTILAESNNITASETLKTTAAVTVIDSSVLRSRTGRQDVQISGAKTVFAAYGRTEDVLAWVGKAKYNRIGVNRTKTALTNQLIPGKTTAVPSPKGSDLWLDEQSAANSVNLTLNVPADISILVVSDGKSPAPNQLSIRWPLDNRTPWSGPLIVGGIVLLIIGIVLYFLALRHLRRSQGPRRKTPKSPKMPKVPRQRSYRPRKPQAIQATPGRRSNRRRMAAVVPVLLIGGLALSGCTSQSWPEFVTGSQASATPTPTSTAATTADLQPPAVTVSQLRTIINRVAAVATKADASEDVNLAKTRFDGAALDLRAANYAVRKVDSTQPALAPIPTGELSISLPQQTNKWPRTVLAVVNNPKDKTVAPEALMLEQKTPRDNYKVEYATALEARAKVPQLAPADLGAPRLAPDVKLLKMEPGSVALAYGDILANGPASTSMKDFDTKNDALIGEIGLDFRKKTEAALPTNAKMAIANSNGPYESIALGSDDAGAIVAVYLNETVTVTPTEAGASVNPEGEVKSLSGLTGSTKGTVAVYGDQLLFFVPSVTSNQKISLLGFATGLVSAKEAP